MSKGNPLLTQAEFDKIKMLCSVGLGVSQVSEVTGRSPATVTRINVADTMEQYRTGMAEERRKYVAQVAARAAAVEDAKIAESGIYVADDSEVTTAHYQEIAVVSEATSEAIEEPQDGAEYVPAQEIQRAILETLTMVNHELQVLNTKFK